MTLRVALVTVGDPSSITGGHLFHQRLAEHASEFDARMKFLSMPALPFPVLGRRRVVRQARVADVIVLDSIAAAYWGRPRGVPPVAAMVHQPPGGIEHGSLRTRVQRSLDLYAYRGVDRMLVASDSLLERMSAHDISVPHAAVPPGRDIATADRAPQDLREGRKVSILCVANWARHKGIVELLDAFASLDPTLATLHLVGDTDADPKYSARIKSRIDQPGMEDRIRVHGVRTHPAIAGLYRDADVFVLPSFRETYGTVYAEAMTAGLPVVGWDTGNLPHLIDDGEAGLIVPVGDVAALSGTLARIATDDDLRRRLGEGAQRRATDLPTWADSASTFFETLRSMVGR